MEFAEVLDWFLSLITTSDKGAWLRRPWPVDCNEKGQFQGIIMYNRNICNKQYT